MSRAPAPACLSGGRRGLRRPAGRRADRRASSGAARTRDFPASAARRWRTPACQACFRSAIWRSSALPPSRRACRKSSHAFGETADAVIAAKPDVLVIIDSPEFTHRVARRVRARAPAIPIVDYVCPSVWAWRPGRARAMRAYVDHVLALLPFEPAVMRQLGGPPCTFVGHPLSERVGELASERRGGAPAARRSAAAAGAAGQPRERNPPHGGRIRRSRGAGGRARRARWRWWCRRCRGLPTRCGRRSRPGRIAGAGGDRRQAKRTRPSARRGPR